jgi:hypothetical protein
MKQTPLLRRTPLRAKAGMQRRAPIKAKRKPAAPAAEKRHVARVAAMPCLACGWAATVHHVTAPITGGRIARSDRRIVPLCNFAPHHQIIYERDAKNPQSVEGLGHPGFYARYGIDLLAEADRLWAESEALEAAK